jgi:hypothetical protein
MITMILLLIGINAPHWIDPVDVDRPKQILKRARRKEEPQW